MHMHIKRLHRDAKMPEYAHNDDAGFDLFSTEEIVIEPGKRVQIKTGIALAIPEGHVGLVWDKSGLSHKKGLKTLGGVVDSGYRGEVLVGMVNTGDVIHTFNIGDKVAQMLIQKIERYPLVEVETLEATERGEGSFGSTGK